jgi:hypothetical protein
MAATLETFERTARALIANADRELKKFSANFDRSPAYAFEWSDSALTAAAEKEFGEILLTWLKIEKITAEQLVQEITSQVRRKAMYPDRSTSSISNEMSLRRMSVMAQWLDRYAA